MSNQANIIPYRFYANNEGKRVSAYTSYVPPGYELQQDGFTVQWSDGTTGRFDGGKPFATVAEGEAYLAKVKAFLGRLPSGWNQR